MRKDGFGEGVARYVQEETRRKEIAHKAKLTQAMEDAELLHRPSDKGVGGSQPKEASRKTAIHKGDLLTADEYNKQGNFHASNHGTFIKGTDKRRDSRSGRNAKRA